MAVLPLIQVPDIRLREVSKPVARVDDKLRGLMDNMLETMYAENGIGLAAIQVGVAKRVIVIDLAREDDKIADKVADEVAEETKKPGTKTKTKTKEEPSVHYFVNPKILSHSKELASYKEGCLSVPEFFDDVDRPATCSVEFLNYEGKKVKMDCDGLLATCIQHEVDHLEGVLFIDHLSRLKRQLILKKIKKKQAESSKTKSRETAPAGAAPAGATLAGASAAGATFTPQPKSRAIPVARKPSV